MGVIYKVGLFDHMNAKEDALYYKIDNLASSNLRLLHLHP